MTRSRWVSRYAGVELAPRTLCYRRRGNVLDDRADRGVLGVNPIEQLAAEGAECVQKFIAKARR